MSYSTISDMFVYTLSIYSKTLVASGGGNYSETKVLKHSNIPCNQRKIQGNPYYYRSTQVEEYDRKFWIDNTFSDITEQDLVLYDGVYYEIDSIIPAYIYDAGVDHYQIMAKEYKVSA